MNIDTKTGGFGSSAEFWNAARKSFTGGVSEDRIGALHKAAMTEGTDSTGGVLVPEKWADEIYSAAMENAIVRPMAVVLPMDSDTLNVPVLVDSSRATNIFGGITLTWVAEGGDKYATTVAPTLGSLSLVAHKAVASCFVSNELEADTRAFGAFMTQAFGRAVRFLEDDLFISTNGNGVGKPLGIMSSGALISVTRTGMSHIDGPDIGSLAARFAPGCWENAVWLINQSVLADWASMNAAAANVSSVVDLTSMTCLGRPIIVTEHCAALGTTGDIILADFSQYIIGQRSLIVSASKGATYSSNSYGFLQGQTMWRMVLRVAGQPIVQAPYTPMRGGSTVGPFVTLTTSS